jgi:hypothetical protein
VTAENVVRADKSALLARRLGEGEHEIPGFGAVRIRGLSRAELLELQTLEGGTAVQDRRMVSLALVDPQLTEDEVKTWQENSHPHEIEGLTLAIAELSGLGVGASKSGVSGVRE